MPKADLSVAAALPRTQCFRRQAIDDRHLIDGVVPLAAYAANDNRLPETNRRYIIRPTGNPHRWCVWDTRRDAVVFGGEDLSESAASGLARRLNDAYRGSQQ